RMHTFATPPHRVISLNDHVHETHIQMSAGDRIVGMGYGEQDEVLPEVAEQFDAIPSLAEEDPTWEQIVDLEPDMVVGGMSSAFNEEEGRSRDALEPEGTDTFLFSAYCGAGFPAPSTLEPDCQQRGSVLAVEEGARELTERSTGELEEARATLDSAGVDGTPTFFYDGGEAEPTTIGGVGVGQLIGEYAGADNIFTEGDRPYLKTTWE